MAPVPTRTAKVSSYWFLRSMKPGGAGLKGGRPDGMGREQLSLDVAQILRSVDLDMAAPANGHEAATPRRVKIYRSKGERLFCSEAEAQPAGWRESKR